MRNLILSAHKIDLNSRCKRKFNFEVNMNLASKELALPLIKGDIFHRLLEWHYKATIAPGMLSQHISDTIEKGRFYAEQYPNLAQDDLEVILRTYKDYAINYKDENMQVDAVEEPFAKILYEDAQLDLRIIIEGTYDILGHNSQVQYVMDHKTSSSAARSHMLFGTVHEEPIRLSNQFQCYSWASERRVLIVNNVVFNLKAEDDKRFRRIAYDYDKHIIEEWKDATIHYALELDACARKEYWPPDFTSCKGFSLCHFYSVCSQAPNMRVQEISANFEEREAYDKNRFSKKD